MAENENDRKALKRRREVAETICAELEMEQTRLSLKDEKARSRVRARQRHLESFSDSEVGVFTLDGTVGNKSVELSHQIRQYGRAFPEAPITLNIFSGGGQVFHGLVLYDTLRTLAEQGHPVTTVCRGYAASMAGLLFVAGDVRIIGAESQVMIHSLSSGTGGTVHDMEDDVKFFRKLDRRLNGIYTKRTKVTREMLAERTRKQDWWLSAEQAIKLKIATDIG